MSMEVTEPKSTRPTSPAYLGSGVIQLPPKASTRVRLHELAHKKFGHEPGKMSVSTLIDRELEAEGYAYKMMDKPQSYKVGIPILWELIVDWDCSRREALNLVISGLKKRGIHVTKFGREALEKYSMRACGE